MKKSSALICDFRTKMRAYSDSTYKEFANLAGFNEANFTFIPTQAKTLSEMTNVVKTQFDNEMNIKSFVAHVSDGYFFILKDGIAIYHVILECVFD